MARPAQALGSLHAALTVLGAAAVGAGCGAAPSALSGTAGPRVDPGVVRTRLAAGPEVAVVRTTGTDLVELGLFLDAGSRDAQPPQVATIAAWLAAEAAPGVRSRVLPDGTEHVLACSREQLRACLGRLASVLEVRRVDPARFSGARARLIEARRRADAADPGRGADALALRALYGEAGLGLVPLGRPEDDAATDAPAVASFLAAHYGPARALLVVAGEVEADAVASELQTVLARAPMAGQAREAARAAPSDGGVAVDVASERALTLALAAPDLERAHAGAKALQARLTRDQVASELRGHVFELRGGALALLRGRAAEPAAAVEAASHELARLHSEGTEAQAGYTPDASVAALVRRLGARWLVQGGTQPDAEWKLGIGVLVAGGRADQPKAEDPDRALRERTLAALQSAFELGRAQAAPELQAQRDASALTATLDNGARIELRAQPSELVAVAVRFRPGAGADPPLWHGRAALLATLATSACKGLGPAQLGGELVALGARLAPRVDADSWGVLLLAPAAHWQAALALALDCALHPVLGRAALATARARLLERHGGEEGALALAADVATQLESETPGALAPWGHPERQASVELTALRELWGESAIGSAVSVAAVGPIDLEPALGLVARRLATLPSAARKPSGPRPSPASQAQPGHGAARATDARADRLAGQERLSRGRGRACLCCRHACGADRRRRRPDDLARRRSGTRQRVRGGGARRPDRAARRGRGQAGYAFGERLGATARARGRPGARAGPACPLCSSHQSRRAGRRAGRPWRNRVRAEP
jgi:predicted Zn-dependent peptidase